MAYINKTIGSQGAQQQQSACAFRTGDWQSGTQLRVYAGEEARIRGRGGEGGKGGDGRKKMVETVEMHHQRLVFNFLREQLF